MRTVANVTTRGWSFYGGGQFTQNELLGIDGYILPALAGACGGYNTLSAQGARADYKATFGDKETKDAKPETATPELTGLLRAIYLILVIGIFISRTITKPVLFTGPIDNPQDNYGTTDAILASVGLLFGLYGSYQYTTKFMAPMLKEALPEVASAVKSMGQSIWKPCSKPRTDLTEPLIPASTSSGALNP